jgi:hypothetical protein
MPSEPSYNARAFSESVAPQPPSRCQAAIPTGANSSRHHSEDTASPLHFRLSSAAHRDLRLRLLPLDWHDPEKWEELRHVDLVRGAGLRR